LKITENKNDTNEFDLAKKGEEIPESDDEEEEEEESTEASTIAST
jgi:hypothetical protein